MGQPKNTQHTVWTAHVFLDEKIKHFQENFEWWIGKDSEHNSWAGAGFRGCFLRAFCYGPDLPSSSLLRLPKTIIFVDCSSVVRNRGINEGLGKKVYSIQAYEFVREFQERISPFNGQWICQLSHSDTIVIVRRHSRSRRRWGRTGNSNEALAKELKLTEIVKRLNFILLIQIKILRCFS